MEQEKIKPRSSTIPKEEYKAFIAVWELLPDIKAVYCDTTAGKARYQCYLAIDDIGYTPLSLTQIKVKRAPHFDHLARNINNQEQISSWVTHCKFCDKVIENENYYIDSDNGTVSHRECYNRYWGVIDAN